MVQMVWRHGDRAPSGLPYPNDRYVEKYWPRGWNQLTNKGIAESVELGVWLRNRYCMNLLKEFNSEKILIRSSDSERAIQTAQAVAAGLFPPNGSHIWETSYLKYWQPIPIHTNGISNSDPLLRPSKIECPEYDRINKEEELPIAEKINQNYSRLFEFLQNVTGMESVNYYTISELYNIERELLHKMPQPNWIDAIFNGSTIMDHIRELKRISRLQDFNTIQKSKFRSGFLLNHFIENMENSMENSTELEAILYSAHEGTLTPLLYSMNVSNNQLVPYNSCIIFELYDDSTVQIWYKNETKSIYPLVLNGCDFSCPLDQFSLILNDVRIHSVEELKEICEIQNSTSITNLLNSDS